MKAAVMRAIGEPLRIEDVRVDGPGPREVLARTVAAGVCHSDLHVLEGSLPGADIVLREKRILGCMARRSRRVRGPCVVRCE